MIFWYLGNILYIYIKILFIIIQLYSITTVISMNSMSMLFVSRLQKFSPHSKEDQSKVSRLVLNFVNTQYALGHETFK